MGKHRVFVYGTLKRGGYFHDALEHSTFVGTGSTVDLFGLYDLGPYPCAVRKSISTLKGEVYEVDRDTFALLDRIESYPELYTRAKVRVSGSFGKVTAWIYLLNEVHARLPEGAKLIVSGYYALPKREV